MQNILKVIEWPGRCELWTLMSTQPLVSIVIMYLHLDQLHSVNMLVQLLLKTTRPLVTLVFSVNVI